MVSYDLLKEAVDFKTFKANEVALNMGDISIKVSDIKVCVDPFGNGFCLINEKEINA